MNWIKSLLTHGLSKKVLLAVFILAAVDMFSMAAPYYLKYVIPNVYNYLHVTAAEFDQLNAVLGYVVLAFQIPSGILADKMSGKKLLIISVVMSGICTVLFGLATQAIYPPHLALPMLYMVFIGFGISTTLFLWSPLWKVLSEQGDAKQQSSLYGLQGSYNGLLGLVFITLIGTFATNLAHNGNNILFYILVYIIAGALFLSAIGVQLFVKDTKQKSEITKKFSDFRKRIYNFKFSKESLSFLQPIKIFRVWLLAVFVMGMYMFQSVFAYYLKSYVGLFLTGTTVAALAGLRTYGLRLMVSGPFGKWMIKRKSWILVMLVSLSIGLLIAMIMVLTPGIGNTFNGHNTNLVIKIIFPILFILVGVISWFLVAGRYMQIDEIPHTKNNYGTTIAIISFIAFSTDAWFYQMASSWAKSSPEIFQTPTGGYSQHGLQLLLLTACSIAAFGALCGMGAFLINKHEIKKLKKSSYRWRSEEERG